MQSKISRIDNPLTVISIFSGIAEGVAAVALPFANNNTQEILAWFLVFFPGILVTLFFATLNFNPKSLYAPTDYRDDQNFLQALSYTKTGYTITTVSTDEAPLLELPALDDKPFGDMWPESRTTNKQIDQSNKFFNELHQLIKILFREKILDTMKYGVKGDGLFLLTVCAPGYQTNLNLSEDFILIASEHLNSEIELKIAGHAISSNNPEEVALKLFGYIKKEMTRRLEDAKKIDE